MITFPFFMNISIYIYRKPMYENKRHYSVCYQNTHIYKTPFSSIPFHSKTMCSFFQKQSQLYAHYTIHNVFPYKSHFYSHKTMLQSMYILWKYNPSLFSFFMIKLLLWNANYYTCLWPDIPLLMQSHDSILLTIFI